MFCTEYFIIAIIVIIRNLPKLSGKKGIFFIIFTERLLKISPSKNIKSDILYVKESFKKLISPREPLIRSAAGLGHASAVAPNVWSLSSCNSAGVRIRDTNPIFSSTAHRRFLVFGAVERRRAMSH